MPSRYLGRRALATSRTTRLRPRRTLPRWPPPGRPRPRPRPPPAPGGRRRRAGRGRGRPGDGRCGPVGLGAPRGRGPVRGRAVAGPDGRGDRCPADGLVRPSLSRGGRRDRRTHTPANDPPRALGWGGRGVFGPGGGGGGGGRGRGVGHGRGDGEGEGKGEGEVSPAAG